ncbi:MAG: hypothetical protein Q9195_008932 [Heterodermia aff. obscurata]
MTRKDDKEDVKSNNKKMAKKEVDESSADESPDSASTISFSPTPEPKRTKAGRSTRPRPKKRNLIRWNVHDQRCLLALQHVMSIKGLKIPWDEVAAKLGPTITEGAIVQHLAKLRNRLADEGVKVTPALQRGGRIRTRRAATDNNVKTVSAKGAVAKRAGKAKPSKSTHSGTNAEKDEIKSGHNSPNKGKAKETVDNGKSDQAGIKTEQHSGDDLKKLGGLPGVRMSYKNDDDDAETIGTNDTIPYTSESENGHEQDAVAIGAPFVELESSIQSSVASSAVSSPARRMVIIPPRSLVIILLIGRTMAKCLAQSEENNCIEERRILMEGGSSQDGYATGSGSLSHQSLWTPGQVDEGHLVKYNGYGAAGSPALEQDNSHLAVSATFGSINPDSVVPSAQSNFAGYGMQNGPLDHRTAVLTSPQHGFQPQYHGIYDQGNNLASGTLNEIGMETAMSGYGFSLDDSFRSPNNGNGLASVNAYGYPYGNNPGFPMSNERSTSRTMAPSKVLGYFNPSGNIGFDSPSNFGHHAISEKPTGLKADQFMGGMNPFDHNLNPNDASNWGSFDHPNYSL